MWLAGWEPHHPHLGNRHTPYDLFGRQWDRFSPPILLFLTQIHFTSHFPHNSQDFHKWRFALAFPGISMRIRTGPARGGPYACGMVPPGCCPAGFLASLPPPLLPLLLLWHGFLFSCGGHTAMSFSRLSFHAPTTSTTARYLKRNRRIPYSH